MSVIDLAIPYGLVGAGGALLSLVAGERRSAADALLLLIVWPIYAPFVLTRGAGSSSSPQVAVLPDPATLAAVEHKLGAARERVAGIARARLANIERLRALQNRFQREIEQVGEVLIELETQAELVRLVGAEDPAMADVLRELGARSESLSLMLADEIPGSPLEPEATDHS